ncbi:hypothetical protein B0H10DRAFT_1947508 [Mycena sp. CBHHK59/15]|nr:hypothetical protein B0H10DRAFT_1947508 [Mycena sp. CBHHK59/15]
MHLRASVPAHPTHTVLQKSVLKPAIYIPKQGNEEVSPAGAAAVSGSAIIPDPARPHPRSPHAVTSLNAMRSPNPLHACHVHPPSWGNNKASQPGPAVMPASKPRSFLPRPVRKPPTHTLYTLEHTSPPPPSPLPPSPAAVSKSQWREARREERAPQNSVAGAVRAPKFGGGRVTVPKLDEAGRWGNGTVSIVPNMFQHQLYIFID